MNILDVFSINAFPSSVIISYLIFSNVALRSPSMHNNKLSLLTMHHFKCRGGTYPRSKIERFSVPDSKVDWSQEYQNYEPPYYTAQSVIGKRWADPEIGDIHFQPKWNNMDGNINRTSYLGAYSVENGYPKNPMGRTGIKGRGLLGRWGPNHAADPIVTRWKKSENNSQIIGLQFIAIKRGDNKEWALPGGMVDPGEKGITAAIREFREEALNSMSMSQTEKDEVKQKFDIFFNQGEEIYKGYVDDPRNTDNAWIETVAYNFHDDNGNLTAMLQLNAGDDAIDVRWTDITPEIQLYASHKQLILEVYNRRMMNKKVDEKKP